MIKILISLYLTIGMVRHICKSEEEAFKVIKMGEQLRTWFLCCIHSDDWVFHRTISKKQLPFIEELNLRTGYSFTKGHMILRKVKNFNHALTYWEWRYLRNEWIDWNRISSILYDPNYRDPWEKLDRSLLDDQLNIWLIVEMFNAKPLLTKRGKA